MKDKFLLYTTSHINNMITKLYKGITIPIKQFVFLIDHIITSVKFRLLGIEHEDFNTAGIPFLDLSYSKKSKIKIGKSFRMNNGMSRNQIGYGNLKCTLIADGGNITIGDNVGMSQSALIAFDADITIGNYVKLGSGVKILTTDFHSVDALVRRDRALDKNNKKSSPVVICDDCFIGAGTIILKGITIGSKSIIGAGSVVTKDIPANVIAAGNPCRVIKQIE